MKVLFSFLFLFASSQSSWDRENFRKFIMDQENKENEEKKNTLSPNPLIYLFMKQTIITPNLQ